MIGDRVYIRLGDVHGGALPTYRPATVVSEHGGGLVNLHVMVDGYNDGSLTADAGVTHDGLSAHGYATSRDAGTEVGEYLTAAEYVELCGRQAGAG